jgi:hypothetical protein
MRYLEGCREPGTWVCLLGLWLLYAVTAHGCAEAQHTGRVPYAQPRRTAHGVLVTFPLGLSPGLQEQCLREVDAESVPGWIAVIVTGTERFWVGYASPVDGRASGQTDMRSWIKVRLRHDPEPPLPLLPALAHEMQHVTTQDPLAGH